MSGSTVVLSALAGILVIGLLSWGARGARRRGLDRRGLLDRARILTQLGLILFLVDASVGWWLEAGGGLPSDLVAPDLPTPGLVALTVTLLLILGQAVPHLGGVLAALRLIVRGELRVGDRLLLGHAAAGGIEPTRVEHLGLFALTLRHADGRRQMVATQVLVDGESAVVEPRDQVVARVRLATDAGWTAEDAEAQAAQAALCPWRRPGTPATAGLREADARVLEVELVCWSEEAAQQAERWLRSGLEGAR